LPPFQLLDVGIIQTTEVCTAKYEFGTLHRFGKGGATP
jgi:hypothetical protein